MLYGKFPVAVLNSLAAEKNGSTNSIIAAYILNHIDEIKEAGIQEIADGAFVSTASITRFCHDIGLEGFAELRELLIDGAGTFLAISASPESLPHQYADAVTHGIEKAAASVSMDDIDLVCRSIHAYEKVHIYGLLKGESAAVNLAADLMMLNKPADTKTSLKEQYDAIKEMGADELVLLFSYTGSYFDYGSSRPRKRDLKPAMIMISGGEDHSGGILSAFVHFDSDQDAFSHPYTLEYIAGLIAQEYARLYCGQHS